LVDQVVVDVGLADLDRAGEEFGDEQVLTLGRDLDDAVGPWTRSRSGVEPTDDSRPTGLTAATSSPSWSRMAWRIASARRPVTST
jgi:hypothetical protein